MTNKLDYMQNIWKISITAIMIISLVSCGQGAKDKKGDLGDKKVQLEKRSDKSPPPGEAVTVESSR